MNEHADNEKLGRQLWRRVAAGAGREPDLPPVDPNVLAAYLEGTAAPDEIGRVEARMAADPAFLEEVMELRQLQAAAPVEAPPALVSRAKALVSAAPTAERAAEGRSIILRVWRRAQWAAAAAAIVLACFGGYSFGRGTSQMRSQLRSVVSAGAAIGLGDADDEGLLELPHKTDANAPGNGRNGGER